MTVTPERNPQRPATRHAVGARSRAPLMWIGIALAILIVFAIGFTLRAVL